MLIKQKNIELAWGSVFNASCFIIYFILD